MSKELGQSERQGKLETVIGSDKLFLAGFAGSEFVNDMFEFQIEAVSKDPKIDINKLIGTHARVDLHTHEHGERSFDGLVVRSQWLGVDQNGIRYGLTLRPWLWRARFRRNQRIFHGQSVVDIIGAILGDYGEPFELTLQGNYKTLEYTVQYRESDFDFLLRMLERFGISYFFRHDTSGHTLVLTDSIDQHPEIPGEARDFLGADNEFQHEREHFTKWVPERNLTTDVVEMTDYNFTKPDAGMKASQSDDTGSRSGGPLEAYDYPGFYLDEGEGKDAVQIRLNQVRSADIRHRAMGNCISLSAGLRVAIGGDEIPDVTGNTFLCVAARHKFAAQAYGSSRGGGREQDYTGSYTLIPEDAPFAPEKRQSEPRINGPQTATVVGPEGEKIHVDKYGRILVRFHWDRDKANSMYCRVMQPSAGNGWGAMTIPRIGMEVVVEFIEGHPDQPLVTGCVYNGKNMPPYELPGNKTRTTFKSANHDESGFNELRFEDEAGDEEIFLHAERYFNAVVKKDATWHVQGNLHKQIGASESLHVGKDRDIEVMDHERKAIGKSQSLTVGEARVTAVGSDDVLAVGGAACISAGGTVRLEAGSNASAIAGMNMNLTAGMNLVIEAGVMLTLKAGGNFITIGPSGIAISGTTVLINSGGAAGSASTVGKKGDSPEKFGGPHAERYDKSKS